MRKCINFFAAAPTSYYDLFRVENGRIAEHGDVMETIAEKSAWQNENGKFGTGYEWLMNRVWRRIQRDMRRPALSRKNGKLMCAGSSAVFWRCNGLEHIDPRSFERVYGVDINENYLSACTRRYPEFQTVLKTIHADLSSETTLLPHADLLISNLFIEYIGYACFQRAVEQVNPEYVYCVIQINTSDAFVSDSPYLHVFDRLDEVHYQIEENALKDSMLQIGYEEELRSERELPNGKKLVRMDYGHSV